MSVYYWSTHIPLLSTDILEYNKHNAKATKMKNVQKLLCVSCPPVGQWHRFVRRWDQFGGCWNQFILSEQQHHSQHPELRKDTEATESPADQPANSAGHHLWLLAHEPLQPLATYCFSYTSNVTGESVDSSPSGSQVNVIELKNTFKQNISTNKQY